MRKARRHSLDVAASLALAVAELGPLREAHTRLLEAEETLRAIRSGEVDALIVGATEPGEQVFTLSSADRPYRIFVENMQEGAATVSGAGVVLFANQKLGEMLGFQVADIVARQMSELLEEDSRPRLASAIGSHDPSTTLELDLRRSDATIIAALVGVARLEVDNERLTCLTFTDLTSEHRLLGEVRASQRRFEALYKGAPIPAYTWQNGPGGLRLIDYNAAAAKLSGSQIQQSLGAHASVYYAHDPQLVGDLTRCFDEQQVIECGVVRRSDVRGSTQHLRVTMVPVPPDLVVVHKQDVTESWVAERALRTSEERYRSIVENAQEGISMLDGEGRFTLANRRTADLLGYDAPHLIGRRASSLFGSKAFSALEAEAAAGTQQHEMTALRPDGTSVNLLVSTAPILLSLDGAAGSLCMMTDVSGLRQAEEELAHSAVHDALTGLPNRTLLVDRIDQAIARSVRQPGSIAALFCDIDDFKEVNDSFGHHVGDEVLKAVAERIRGAIRSLDTVSRLGGDEFVVLCEAVEERSTAFDVAARILGFVQAPLEIAGHELSLSVSVGVAFGASGDSAELLRNADAAMYLAKQRGRNRVELFDENERKVASERISLITDLRHAVARNELRIHYQPVFSLEGEQMQGVEALVRWQHPTRGLLFPDSFIPAAESANLIGEIGAWVLQAACKQAARWSHAGPGSGPLHMAVNVSARQLARGSGLVALVAKVLTDSRIDPTTLILEVTESAVMDDAEATLAILTELKGLGVQLAIDDFGTGYSSLIYLKRFPVDQLKVDRTFVSGLGTNPDDSAIVASVVSLARAVGIVAIAEGVETVQQLQALQQLGCGFGQGYLWSRPVSADEINQLTQQGPFSTPHPRNSSETPLPMSGDRS